MVNKILKKKYFTYFVNVDISPILSNYLTIFATIHAVGSKEWQEQLKQRLTSGI